MVEIQGIWDEETEKLKSVIAMCGIVPKGMYELKKRILEDDVANFTRSRKHYKPSFLEKDHLGRNLEEGLKPIGLDGKEEKEEDRVSTQLKKTQAHLSVWGLANGLSQASQRTPKSFEWERSAYRDYALRGSISHGG